MITWNQLLPLKLNSYRSSDLSPLLSTLARESDVTFEGPWPLRPEKAKMAFDATVVSPLRQDARANPFNPAFVLLYGNGARSQIL